MGNEQYLRRLKSVKKMFRPSPEAVVSALLRGIASIISTRLIAGQKPHMGGGYPPHMGVPFCVSTVRLLDRRVSKHAYQGEKRLKAVYISHENGAGELVVGEMPMPHPTNSELLIQVNAAGITPTELLWYPSTHTSEGTERRDAIPGHEFSGQVVSIGNEVEGYALGDQVYGMNDWFVQGAMAEYCLASPSGISLKPAKLSHLEAAVVPIGALTAWQGLFIRGKLKAGERLLVHGGSGSVGAFVIQLAKLHGADVIATCSHRNMEFVRSLKADEVIDYEATRFEDVVSSVDMVFDAVGGDSLVRSWPLLRDGGRVVTIAADLETTEDPRIKAAFFIVQPDHQQLSDLGPLLDAGYVRPFVGATLSLLRAPEAYRGRMTSNSGHGKAVVVMSDPGSRPR
jgi:NADPH:quinone reductase-like Zn-dependent oxidoreductase